MIINDETLAWHWTKGDKLRNRRPVPPSGEWLIHEGRIVICVSGLHASESLIDALLYAPGSRLHRVTVRKIADRHLDKLVCSERRVEWSFEAEDVLHAFARRCALDVAYHAWADLPVVIQKYLETGRDDLRSDASAAASAAARAAANAAAAAATRGTPWGATWVATRDATRDAAMAKYNEWLLKMIETVQESKP